MPVMRVARETGCPQEKFEPGWVIWHFLFARDAYPNRIA